MSEPGGRGPAGGPSRRKPPATEDERLLASQPPRSSERLTEDATDAWRVFRIMGEFVAGFEEMSQLGPCVTVFGSARTLPTNPLYALCVETARALGEAGFAIMTGGGPGIMEAANLGAREAGVVSVGCNIELPREQGTNRFVDVSLTFHHFFVRKTMFLKYSEAFVIFPGGFGTLDELFEALTLVQTGKVRDFPVVLVGLEYWEGLIDWIHERVAGGGKISPEEEALIYVTDSPEEVVARVSENYSKHLERTRVVEGNAASAPPAPPIL
jgi:uncharacterized protein (TIGR00730 family)